MPTRREVVRLAERIASAPTVSYREHEVLARIREELDRIGVPHAGDRSGNLIARYRGARARGRPVAVSAHTDHPGLIVLSSRGMSANARWIGGVLPRYFPGARVRVETAEGPVRGEVVGTELGERGRVSRVHLRLARPVPAGSIGGWDLRPFRRVGDLLRTKSADDLLGCAAQIALLADLVAARAPLEVWAVFTRAEEDGLFGATALAEDRVLPSETAVVVLETSKELPCGRIGSGPVVRVGDRRSVFHPEVSQCLQEAAEALAKEDKSFRYQRGLMDGGVCEATAYQAFGYAAGGLALALGNYHNMGRSRIGEEFVHVEDLVNLTRLLPAAVGRLAAADPPLAPVRRNLRRRLPQARRELESTRALPPARVPVPGRRRRALLGAAFALLLAPGASHAVLPSWAADPAPEMMAKPGAPPILASPLVPPDAPLQQDYDALRYDILLRIDPVTERISGRSAMTFRAETDLSAVLLDLHDSLVADSAFCDGVACALSRPEPGKIEVVLPALTDSAEVVVFYQGTPGPPYFSGFEFYASHGEEPAVFPVVSTLSQPDRAHGWWPCKDVMDDKAIVSLTVEAPGGFIVAGNGNKVLEEPTGEGVRVRWESRYPIATYLVSFAATNYAAWSETYHASDGADLPLEYYAYPEEEADARIDYQVVPEALAVFETLFGPYPFRDPSIGVEKLGVAEFSWRSGAMEHQTCVSYGEGFLTGDRRNDWALAHEIAHQWWGDAVTPETMEDIWLNEGFASYCEALFAEARGGVREYRRSMLQIRARPDNEYLGTIVSPILPFNPTVYRKGAWFLHMLRGQLGTDVFFQALGAYLERYRYGNATTAGFLRAVEETSLEDLRDFTIPWLYGTGRPWLAWDWWDASVGDAPAIRLHVEQTQEDPTYPVPTPDEDPPDCFSFPLEVRAFAGSDSVSRMVLVRSRRHVEVLDLPFRPDSVALDPDHWVLRELMRRGEALPVAGVLAWPNPARDAVQILARNPRAGSARIAVFDLGGRKVRDLGSITGMGSHILAWDGRNEEGRRLASGLYFVRLAGAGGTQTARLVIAH